MSLMRSPMMPILDRMNIERSEGIGWSVLEPLRLAFPDLDDIHIVGRSDRFVAFLSKGPICRGHSLVAPFEKHLNFAHTVGDNLGALAELEYFINETGKRLSVAFGGDILEFEHGPSKAGSALGCSVDYAHIHLLPVHLACAEMLLGKDLKWIELGHRSELAKSIDAKYGYLFLSFKGNMWVAQANVDTPSQYFRRRLSQNLAGCEYYDWRQVPSSREVLLAASQLRRMR